MLGLSLSLGIRPRNIGIAGVAPVALFITPATGSGVGGDSFTITGTNFAGTMGVLIGGTPAGSITIIDSTIITGVTPSGLGTVDVVVSNAFGSSTLANGFTYI